MFQDVNRTGNILYTGKSYGFAWIITCYRLVLNLILSEFVAAALEAKGNFDKRRLADAFNELDEDGTGYISRVRNNHFSLVVRCLELTIALYHARRKTSERFCPTVLQMPISTG